jgi:hypothetical protein
MSLVKEVVRVLPRSPPGAGKNGGHDNPEKDLVPDWKKASQGMHGNWGVVKKR